MNTIYIGRILQVYADKGLKKQKMNFSWIYLEQPQIGKGITLEAAWRIKQKNCFMQILTVSLLDI